MVSDPYRSNERRPRPRGVQNLQFRGLSTDLKPGNPLDRDTFYAYDTGEVWIYWDHDWRLRDTEMAYTSRPDQTTLTDLLNEIRLLREGAVLSGLIEDTTTRVSQD